MSDRGGVLWSISKSMPSMFGGIILKIDFLWEQF